VPGPCNFTVRQPFHMSFATPATQKLIVLIALYGVFTVWTMWKLWMRVYTASEFEVSRFFGSCPLFCFSFRRRGTSHLAS
jgi:hypothetical protein